MQPLKAILPSRIKETGLGKNILIAQILAEARNWILENWGERIASKIAVSSLVRGEIIMRSEKQSLIEDITLKEREIIFRINSKFDGKIISRIRFLS